MNIYKRGKTWTFVVEGPKIGGRRNRITKGGFKTKKACEKEAIALEHELNLTGSAYRDNNILYIDLVNDFLEYHKQVVKKTTFITSKGFINHSKSFFKNYLIKDIKVIDCQKFINSLIAKNLSPNYIKDIFNRMKQVFNYGNDIIEVINYKPNFNKVILPKIITKVRDDILTDIEINNILEKYKGTIYYYIFQVAIMTGMRKGEILALTWDKIDLEKNLIYVDKTLTSLRELTSPKTSGSIRIIPMSSPLKKILLDLKNFTKRKLNFSLDQNKIVLSEKEDLDFLFRNPKGVYINIYCMTHKIAKEPFHMHQFRHYFATKLINSGVPIAEVSKILGHAEISTTLKMYVGTTKNVNLTDKLNEIFGQQMDNK